MGFNIVNMTQNLTRSCFWRRRPPYTYMCLLYDLWRTASCESGNIEVENLKKGLFKVPETAKRVKDSISYFLMPASRVITANGTREYSFCWKPSFPHHNSIFQNIWNLIWHILKTFIYYLYGKENIIYLKSQIEL